MYARIWQYAEQLVPFPLSSHGAERERPFLYNKFPSTLKSWPLFAATAENCGSCSFSFHCSEKRPSQGTAYPPRAKETNSFPGSMLTCDTPTSYTSCETTDPAKRIINRKPRTSLNFFFIMFELSNIQYWPFRDNRTEFQPEFMGGKDLEFLENPGYVFIIVNP